MLVYIKIWPLLLINSLFLMFYLLTRFQALETIVRTSIISSIIVGGTLMAAFISRKPTIFLIFSLLCWIPILYAYSPGRINGKYPHQNVHVIIRTISQSTRHKNVENILQRSKLNYTLFEGIDFSNVKTPPHRCNNNEYYNWFIESVTEDTITLLQKPTHEAWTLILENDAIPIVSPEYIGHYLSKIIHKHSSDDVIWLDLRTALYTFGIPPGGGGVGMLFRSSSMKLISSLIVERFCTIEQERGYDVILSKLCELNIIKCSAWPLFIENGSPSKTAKLRQNGIIDYINNIQP